MVIMAIEISPSAFEISPSAFMLCETADEHKAKQLANTDNWIFEQKFDGCRVMLVVENYKATKIITRRTSYNPNKFPEFKNITFPFENGVLDGELMSDNFEHTNSRLLCDDDFKQDILAKVYPLKYYCFDILFLNGKDERNTLLSKRKEILGEILKTDVIGFNNVIVEVKAKPFDVLWRDVLQYNQEGVIAKDSNSVYVSKRSNSWLKIKNWKEAIVEFDGYEKNIDNHGITLTNKDGIRVAVGSQAIAQSVMATMELQHKVRAEIQYLEKTSNGLYRFPTLKEIIYYESDRVKLSDKITSPTAIELSPSKISPTAFELGEY